MLRPIERKESSLSLDLDEDILKAVQDNYPELLKTEPNESDFLADVKNIIDECMPHFREDSPPLFFEDTWNKRRNELRGLIAVFTEAKQTKYDFFLFNYCRNLASQNDSVFLKLTNWNFLPDRMRSLLNRYNINPALTINLATEEKDKDLQARYIKLHCAYSLLHKRMQEYKSELDASKDYQHLQQRVESNFQSAAFQRGVIGELEKENRQLRDINAQRNGVSDQRELTELQQKVQELERKLFESFGTNKHITDQNQLLEAQMKRMNSARSDISPLEEENSQLKLTLAAVRNSLQKKTTKIAELERKVHAIRIEVQHDHLSEPEQFADAAIGKEQALEELSRKFLGLLEQLDTKIQAGDFTSQPGWRFNAVSTVSRC